MTFKYVLLASVLSVCLSDKDDKKWVWDENSRSSNARGFIHEPSTQDSKVRYNVYEETDEYRPIENQYYPSTQPLPINQRPTPIYQNRPPISGTGVLPQERPGGAYGAGNRPSYGQGPYYPEGENPGVLTGPVPSWVKEGPIKNFDKCKCTEKFNCNSPGISYGHCDAGKQYCCYSTKNKLGGPIPSQPVHSLENGVLVGPGGPVDHIPGITAYPRPPKQISGYYRPHGGFHGHQGPVGSVGGNFNYNERPGGHGFGGYRGEANEYSPANGVLVGPGGPYDGGFGLGRSAKSIQSRSAKKE